MEHRRKNSTEDETNGCSAPPSAFWSVFWLAAVFLAAKAFYLSFLASDPPVGFASSARSLAAISYGDVLFAAGLGAVHRAVVAIGGSGMPIRRGFSTIYVLAAAYAVANLEVFGFFLTPLTYPLLWLVGDLRSLSSSVAPFVTAPLLAAALIAALAPTRLAAMSGRLAAVAAPARLKVLRTVVAMAAAGWVAWGRHEFAAGWEHRLDRRIAESAHWTLLSTTARATLFAAPAPLAGPVPAADLEDFLSVAERARVAMKAGVLRKVTITPAIVGPAAKPIRNVILLVMESLSARSLEIYGSPYPATPNLTAEARRALVFYDFYAHAGRSSDALAALLLSVHPRMSWRDVTADFPELPGSSLAELLKERGYRTGFLTSGDLGWAGWRGFIQGRGYDTIRQWSDLDCRERLSSWGVEDRCLIEAMLGWMEQNPSRPFFLTAWTEQTHHPYEPSPGVPPIDFFGPARPPDDYDFGRYLNALHETDRHVGRLFAWLREHGLEGNTLVVIVGDHGEAFGQPHGSYGHGTALYEENVHIPMILWSPRLFPNGARSQTIGSHVDVSPTIAEILGISPAGSWQGRSLFDPNRPSRAYFFVANDDYLLGLREERWKYILDATGGREELYDLTADPDEKRNLADLHPEVRGRLRSRLAARAEAGRRFFASLGGL